MTRYHMPAEWEHQRMMQLTWPHSDTDWAYCLDDITDTFLTLAQTIARYEKLLVVTPHPHDTRKALADRMTDEELQNVTVCQCPTNDTWARDHGALTLLGTEPDDMRLLDFQFNGWGKKFEATLDNAINRHLTEAGVFDAPLIDHNDFVLEGGSVESDGKGNIFTTSQCLLAPNRNQPLTAEGIEEQLLQRLHANRIVWLHHGTLTGDDTDGHIDTIVRCAPQDTLLYVTCHDTADEQYDDFHALENELQALRTDEGQPFSLLPLPMPAAIFEDGQRLPATYANFVVINGAVIVPTYGQPDTDEEAQTIIGQAFPGRDIIGIDARQVIRQHGSLHCLTMQYY